MKKISVPIKMLLTMIISAVLFFTFDHLNKNYKLLFLHCLRDIFLAVFYHFIVMYVTAPFVRILFRMKFNYRNAWFSQKSFEKSFYEFIKVKKWKNKAAIYDKEKLSIKTTSIYDAIMYMCHAEVTHELIAILSFTSIFLLFADTNLIILCVSSFAFAAIHLGFAIIQRYNRPRAIKILNRACRKSKSF